MSKVCGVLPDDVNRALNELAKSYKDSGMSNENARTQAANDILQTLEQDTTLGSQSAQAKPNQTQQLWEEKLLTQGLQDTYDRLGQADTANPTIDSDQHKKHLQSVLDELITPLLHTLDAYTITAEQATVDTIETQGLANLSKENITITVGKSPRLNSLYMSAQETLAHELVHTITSTILAGKAVLKAPVQLKQGVRKLYNLTKSKIKPSDLIPKDAQGNPIIPHGGTLADAEAAANERWDYIFNTKEGIQEFVAFGNTNEQFIKLLKGITVQDKVKGDGTLSGAISAWFQNVVNWLANKTYHLQGDADAASALHKLTLEIANIKKKNNYLLKTLGYAGEGVRYAATKPIQLIFAGLSKGIDILPEGKSKRLLQGIKHLPMGAKTKHFAQAMGYTADRIFKQREYFIYNILSKLPAELVGMNPENARFWTRLRYSKGIVDVARHKMKESQLLNFKEMFKTPLTEEEDKSLYNLIAIDAPDLLKAYTYPELLDLMKDKGKLNQEISKLKDKLIQAEGNLAYGLIRQADGLGKFMVHKKTFNDIQMMNVSNIVDLRFDYHAGANKTKLANREQAYADVELLKSLYAMSYVNPAKMKHIIAVTERELAADPLENGVVNFVSMIGVHQVKSLEMNFGGKEKLKRAGYASEIYNPNVSIKFSQSSTDKDLIKQGYELVDVNPLKRGKGARHAEQYMYVSNHNGLVPYNKAIVSLTSQQKFGTDLADVYRGQGFHGREAFELAEEDTKNIMQSSGNPYAKNYNPDVDNALIPVTNEDGYVTGFRYAMSELNREKYLEKNYRASTVISTMFEQVTDKYESKNLNKLLVQDLIADKKEFGVSRAKDFITITEDHPKYGELYKRLPLDMKRDLDAAFGDGNLIVREAMIDLVFGFPQYSITNEGLENFIGKTMLMIMSGIVGMRNKDARYATLSQADKAEFKKQQGKILLKQVEDVIQEIVAEVKSTIVLKTLVLPVNIASNMFFSFMHGVPVDYMLKKQAEAIIALQDYNEKLRRKMILEIRRDAVGISVDRRKAIQGHINQLDADLETNVVKELMDKGVLNSIVEDISLDLDTNAYSMRNKLASWMEDKTSKVPEGIKTTYKWAYLTRDVKAYKLLETTTRYSDFVARYAMYEWLTKEKKIPEANALSTVMAAFVEYDPPTSKELQYLNDMGFAMFTKYAIRIQKAVAKLFLDKPDTAIGLAMLEHMVGGNYPTPVDAFARVTINHALQDPTVTFVPGIKLFEDYSNLALPGTPVDII